MVDLEWDDEEENEAVNVENDGAVSGEELVGNPQTGENGRKSSNSDERRARRPPGWMRKYVNGEGLSEEKDIDVNLALEDSYGHRDKGYREKQHIGTH